mmetsp:Transcript_63780/g.146782  ORF Transcript_63780/g.146782 Transcript_63780/m.146782 type:complete len:506 (+) Transcript_63780:48-1565(+)
MAQVTESWKVKWTDRAPAPAGEKLCGGVVALVMVAQLGFVLAFIAAADGYIKPAGDNCDSGYSDAGAYCLTQSKVDEINAEMDSCWGTGSNYRQLQATDNSFPHMWDVLERVWHVPLVMLVATILVSVLWVFAMLKKARATLIASAVVAELILAVVLVMFLTEEGIGMEPTLAIALIMVAVGVYYARFWSKLPMAASCITNACKAVFEECSILTACFAAMVCYAVYTFLWVYGMMSSPIVLQFDCDSGTLGNPGWVDSGRQFCGVAFAFTTFFFMNISNISCATGVAAWYFKDADAPKSPGWVGFRWAFTTLLPANGVATVVMYIIMRIRRMSSSIWANCTTCGVCYLMWCMVGKCFETLTRFALVCTVYRGGGFFDGAKKGHAMLLSVLGDGLVGNFFAQFALELALKVFSIAVGMSAWLWIDEIMDAEVLQDVDGVGVVFLCLLMYFFVANPLFTIVLCCLVGNLIKCNECYRGSSEWAFVGACVTFLAAAFIGAVSYVVLNF